MSTVERESWHCDVCGFEWLKTDGINPVQCASSKCRSRKWNLLGGATDDQGGVLERIKVGAVGGLEPGDTSGGKIGGELLGVRNGASGAGRVNGKGDSKVGKAIPEKVSAGWFPHDKCPHGWQNSFACEQGGGGCKR